MREGVNNLLSVPGTLLPSKGLIIRVEVKEEGSAEPLLVQTQTARDEYETLKVLTTLVAEMEHDLMATGMRYLRNPRAVIETR